MTSVASFLGRLLLCFLDCIHVCESCVQSIMQNGRWPVGEDIGTDIIYSESEEVAASSASMLGTPMLAATLPTCYLTNLLPSNFISLGQT